MLTWSDVGIVVRTVHGKRPRELSSLVQQIGQFDDGRKIAHHQHGRTVSESYADALSVWAMARRWVLQFEDDAFLSPDFGVHTLRFINEIDDREEVGLLSLYSGRRVREDEFLPSPPQIEYLAGSKFLMAQAIAIRSDRVADHNAFMLDWTASRDRPYATDTGTAAWLQVRKLRLARAWPSIVQHRQPPSLYGHNHHPNRESMSFRKVYGEPNGLA